MSNGTDIIEASATTTSLARRGDDHSPLPVFNAKQMGEALIAYQGLQQALDKAMPDQIMDLDGKKFRKKGYWRAVAVAFNISVETVEERREENGIFKDGRPNFGYVISKRATAPNGRSVTADGTCFAVEKARRFKCPHPHSSWKGKSEHFPHSTCPDFDPEFQWRTLSGDATEHNVRGHASTRAFNRAVSDLVGFGEVSAEEITQDEHEATASTSSSSTSTTARPTPAAEKSQTSVPSANAAAPVSPSGGMVYIKDVREEEKTYGAQHQKAGQTYIRYTVTDSDGIVSTTVFPRWGRKAQSAMKERLPVQVAYTEKSFRGKVEYELSNIKDPEIQTREPGDERHRRMIQTDEAAKNRFDVQVVFDDIAFSTKNRKDVVLTPDDVATELESFCKRIRNGGKVPAPSTDLGYLRAADDYATAVVVESDGYPMTHSFAELRTIIANAFLAGESFGHGKT